MKGAQDIPGVLGMLLIGFLTIGLVYLLIQFVFTNLIPLFAESSTEVVSRDLAGYITISGIAPYKITINYNASENILYNATIDSRILTVSILQSNPQPLTYSASPYSQYSTQKIAVGDLSTAIINAHEFTIQKETQFTQTTSTSSSCETQGQCYVGYDCPDGMRNLGQLDCGALTPYNAAQTCCSAAAQNSITIRTNAYSVTGK
jgi:hypothetical protein